MNKELWQKAVAFHGHACPGLAYGALACEAAIQKLGVDPSADEELVCVSENDACGVDAIQAILSCTTGKGNLIIRDLGKSVYTFFNRQSGETLRLSVKIGRGEAGREEWLKKLLTMDVDEVFDCGPARIELPEKARLFASVRCELCGEKAAEHKIRLQEGKKVCLDCFRDYSRNSH